MQREPDIIGLKEFWAGNPKVHRAERDLKKYMNYLNPFPQMNFKKKNTGFFRKINMIIPTSNRILGKFLKTEYPDPWWPEARTYP